MKSSAVQNFFDSQDVPPSFSMTFRSQTIQINDDCQVATGGAGYSSVLSSMKFKEGANYFEIQILEPKQAILEGLGPPAIRMGILQFSNKLAQQFTKNEPGRVSQIHGKSTDSIDFPVGFSHRSYAYASSTGNKFSGSIGQEYGQEYGPGDRIGCFLQSVRNSPTREAEDQQSSSYIEFFKNDESQGIAFSDIYVTSYSPAVSLYNGARVRITKLRRNKEFLD